MGLLRLLALAAALLLPGCVRAGFAYPDSLGPGVEGGQGDSPSGDLHHGESLSGEGYVPSDGSLDGAQAMPELTAKHDSCKSALVIDLAAVSFPLSIHVDTSGAENTHSQGICNDPDVVLRLDGVPGTLASIDQSCTGGGELKIWHPQTPDTCPGTSTNSNTMQCLSNWGNLMLPGSSAYVIICRAASQPATLILNKSW